MEETPLNKPQPLPERRTYPASVTISKYPCRIEIFEDGKMGWVMIGPSVLERRTKPPKFSIVGAINTLELRDFLNDIIDESNVKPTEGQYPNWYGLWDCAQETYVAFSQSADEIHALQQDRLGNNYEIHIVDLSAQRTDHSNGDM